MENSKLNKHLIAINLAEEQAGIYRLFDLWEQVLYELKKQHNYEIEIPEYNTFKEDQAYTRHLYKLINEFCAKTKKRIILLIDNFDRIVENFTDDGALLRETLINFKDIQIIAGSTRMDEHFWSYDMPFYNFFRTHRLEALSREEINILLLHWSTILDIKSLKDFVKNNPGKIENIRLLTDGLPRTLQFFIQIVLQKSETNIYDYLKKTMDNVSPLYQERLNSLPSQLRKIVYEMAFIWEACSTKQLVEKVKMESKLISANLKTLVEKGIVDKLETDKKQHLYRISERFFNMWLIFTQGNPEQKRKAKCLTLFLENWYDAADLKKIADDHIDKLKSGTTNWNQSLLFSKALSQSKYITTQKRDTIIELTEQILEKSKTNLLIELPEKFTVILKKIEKYYNEENYKKALELSESIENEEGGIKFYMQGIIFQKQEDYEKAERYYLKAVDNGEIFSLNNLGLLYENQKKYDLAEKYYLLAIKKEFNYALINLANLYMDQEKYKEAENYFLKSIEKGHIDALNNLAINYCYQKKYEEAENYYLHAIAQGHINALFNIANLYNDQKKYEKAEYYYIKAIDKGNNNALYNLAMLYMDQKKYNEAESYYLKAIEKGNISSLNNIGVLYESQEKYNEAKNYYLHAIDKGHIDAFYNLANLYLEQKKYNEAEKYYLKAIEKGNIEALNNIALLYENQERYEEAEKFYIKAIDNGHDKTLFNIAVSYYSRNKNKHAALAYISKYCQIVNNERAIILKILIEIWNGIFDNIEDRAKDILRINNTLFVSEFIIDLLIHQQKSLVLKLFNNNEIGKELQEKYAVLYYVTLILNNQLADNLLLKIPPEIQSTINEVIDQVNEKEKFYGYK